MSTAAPLNATPAGDAPLLREVPYGSALYRLTLAFRDAWLRRPLGLVLSAEDHAGEETQLHFAALHGDAPAGGVVCATVVLKPLPLAPGAPARAKLRQMAVVPEHRGTGLGRRLVRHAEAAAVRRGIGVIELGARASATGFYETLGYAVAGDTYREVGLPHVPMWRRLDG